METENNSHIFFKLVTLWVITEAFLGGIIHAIKLPISGILVGGGAAICISLIAFYTKSNTKILVATLLVAIFKMMLSPHSPPPAYIAVFFQGLIGFIIFDKTKFFKIRCLLFTCLSFLESSVQRVLVTTLIYGKNFWVALNQFIQDLTQSNQLTNYAYVLISVYILVHILFALILGWYIAKLPNKINEFIPIADNQKISSSLFSQSKKDNSRSYIKWIVFILLTSSLYYLSIQGFFHVKMSKQIIEIIFRSTIILSIWKFILGPISTKFIKAFLTKQKGKYSKQIDLINSMLPSMKDTINQAWYQAKNQPISRLRKIDYVVLHTLHHIISDDKK